MFSLELSRTNPCSFSHISATAPIGRATPRVLPSTPRAKATTTSSAGVGGPGLVFWLIIFFKSSLGGAGRHGPVTSLNLLLRLLSSTPPPLLHFPCSCCLCLSPLATHTPTWCANHSSQGPCGVAAGALLCRTGTHVLTGKAIAGGPLEPPTGGGLPPCLDPSLPLFHLYCFPALLPLSLPPSIPCHQPLLETRGGHPDACSCLAGGILRGSG